MANYQTEDTRTVALVGHSGGGKTYLLEALLARSGTISSPGSIERGTTISDTDPLEKHYRHSLNTSIASIDYQGTHITLIDTPGLTDFRGPTLAAMAATETTAIVINAQAGIELATRRLLRRARQRKLCRMIIINKIDAEGVDLGALVEEIREEFGNECLPVNLPAENFSCVRDCFFRAEGETDILSLPDAHTQIVDQVVEMDEQLMERYLEQGELSTEQLHDAFEEAMRSGHLVPICFTSAKTGTGLEGFLKFCHRLLPNPAEGNPPPFIKGEGEQAEPVSAQPDPSGHVIAHVFKTINDPFVGKLSVFRIYQGTIKPDTQLFIGNGRKPFKVNHLFRLQGSKHIEVEQGLPGDICAVAKVDEIHYDDVLHDSHDEDHFHLKPVDFPRPMYGLAVEPKTRGQEQKVANAINRLAEEDPCLAVEHNQELNETVVHGLGEMHLRIFLEHMKERYGAEVDTRPPRIAYRETITQVAEGHYRHKKQTGGAGQFGEVFLRIRPLERGSGFQFNSAVVGGAIPTSLIPAVEKGVRQVLSHGAVAGYPLQDVAVEVYDGKHHSVDSKEIAFVTAGRKAFLAAIQEAKPQVLEPIVSADVTVPEGNMGDITGSLAAKRARIHGSENHRGGMVTIQADVPMSSLMDYLAELKSLTGGQGSFTMDFSHYDPVPHEVQQALVAAHDPRDEEH
jgi:elongation factor G